MTRLISLTALACLVALTSPSLRAQGTPSAIEQALRTMPEGATSLIQTGMPLWSHAKGKACQWAVSDSVCSIKPGTGSLVTRTAYGDLRLHVEFRLPARQDGRKGQSLGNSGVYLQRRYEVQILDTYDLPLAHDHAGALYRLRAPDAKVTRPPGAWQTYDICFRAARFEDGKKTENARITVVHNGTLIHDDVEVPRKTGAGQKEGPEPGPILLQDHGAAVSFRNLWIKPLDLSEKRTTIAAFEPFRVVPKGSSFRRLATGFGFTEGPARAPDGSIYFTDLRSARIHRFDPKLKAVSTYREQSGGANGLAFDGDGRLWACEGGARRVTRTSAGQREVMASRHDAKLFNSPNDITLHKDGGAYFTDPRYGDRSNMELPFEGVFHRDGKGQVRCVVDSLVRPNGLILSGDQKTLYVADNQKRTIVRCSVQADGSLGKPQPFAHLDLQARGGGDGMSLDARGNVYCAGQGAIWVWDSAGHLIQRLVVPESPTNCTFGGPEGRTLFVTARTSFYAIDLLVPGHGLN